MENHREVVSLTLNVSDVPSPDKGLDKVPELHNYSFRRKPFYLEGG